MRTRTLSRVVETVQDSDTKTTSAPEREIEWSGYVSPWVELHHDLRCTLGKREAHRGLRGLERAQRGAILASERCGGVCTRARVNEDLYGGNVLGHEQR